MKRLIRRFLAFRDRVHEAERPYGWLFPALSPFCVIAAVCATLMIPVIGHWEAVQRIEAAGGHVQSTSAYLPALGVRVPLLAEAPRVELRGSGFDDQDLKLLEHLRGLHEVWLTNTRISSQAIDRLRQDHPQLTVRRL